MAPGINAFATPEYPVLFSVLPDEDRPGRVSRDRTAVALALLVDGAPSFLATHMVPNDRLTSLVASLEEGDVRIAVVGLRVELDEDVPGMGLRARDEHPAAYISVVCADGRRVTVARILARDAGQSPRALARHVVREITRGVQIPELASTP